MRESFAQTLQNLRAGDVKAKVIHADKRGKITRSVSPGGCGMKVWRWGISFVAPSGVVLGCVHSI